MLVITRKLQESVLIDGGRIIVTVVRINGDEVRLGIEAPDTVTIRRSEMEQNPARCKT